MAAQAEAGAAVVLHHRRRRRQRGEADRGLRRFRPVGGGGEQRQRVRGEAGDRPECRAAIEAEAGEGVRRGQRAQGGGGNPGAAPEIVHTGVGGRAAGGDEAGGVGFGQAFDHAQAEAKALTRFAARTDLSRKRER